MVNRNARWRGRPKLTWDVVVRKDMNLLDFTGHIPLDRTEQRKLFIYWDTTWFGLVRFTFWQ